MVKTRHDHGPSEVGSLAARDVRFYGIVILSAAFQTIRFLHWQGHMTIRPTPGDGSFPNDQLCREPAEISGFQTREQMIQQAVTMMRLRGEGRFAELAQLITEDAEMVFPGIPGQSPFNGTFKGKDACLAAMKANFTLIEFIDLQARSVLAEGDTVVINWACKMRNRGTGPLIPVEGMARVRFRNRQMCFYGNHLDTAALAALAQFPPLRLP
jgi:hypothetical protein